jgi:hypothetical protein
MAITSEYSLSLGKHAGAFGCRKALQAEIEALRARVELLEGVLSDAGIRYCRVCGCTDDYACDEGCEWAEEDLCSACVAKAARSVETDAAIDNHSH